MNVLAQEQEQAKADFEDLFRKEKNKKDLLESALGLELGLGLGLE